MALLGSIAMAGDLVRKGGEATHHRMVGLLVPYQLASICIMTPPDKPLANFARANVIHFITSGLIPVLIDRLSTICH